MVLEQALGIFQERLWGDGACLEKGTGAVEGSGAQVWWVAPFSQHSQVFFHQAAFQLFLPKPGAAHGVVMIEVHYPVLHLVESLAISCQLGCHILAMVKMLYSNGGACLTSLFPREAAERIHILVWPLILWLNFSLAFHFEDKKYWCCKSKDENNSLHSGYVLYS